jgi:hypothetical protein
MSSAQAKIEAIAKTVGPTLCLGRYYHEFHLASAIFSLLDSEEGHSSNPEGKVAVGFEKNGMILKKSLAMPRASRSLKPAGQQQMVARLRALIVYASNLLCSYWMQCCRFAHSLEHKTFQQLQSML